MFNEYPYVNLQDVNLDWILKHIKDLENNLQDFVKLNTIKYADPIIWNITTQYETNTVVIDGNTGTAYLSVAPVPAGVALTNTDYWTPIFTLSLMSANQNITFRDDGTNVISTFASDTGDWILWNFYLYRVTQPISINTAYLEGFNIERFTVELFIKDYINTLNGIIGDLGDLDTSDKTSIVNAINEIYHKDLPIYTPKKLGMEGQEINDIIQALPANSKLIFPTGTYTVTNEIVIDKVCEIDFNNSTLIYDRDNFITDTDVQPLPRYWGMVTLSPCIIKNATIDCGNENHYERFYSNGTLVYDHNLYGIVIRSSNTLIENVHIKDTAINGITIYKGGIHNVQINRCSVLNSCAALHVETPSDESDPITAVSVNDCFFSAVYGASSGGGECNFTNCYIERAVGTDGYNSTNAPLVQAGINEASVVIGATTKFDSCTIIDSHSTALLIKIFRNNPMSSLNNTGYGIFINCQIVGNSNYGILNLGKVSFENCNIYNTAGLIANDRYTDTVVLNCKLTPHVDMTSMFAFNGGDPSSTDFTANISFENCSVGEDTTNRVGLPVITSANRGAVIRLKAINNRLNYTVDMSYIQNSILVGNINITNNANLIGGSITAAWASTHNVITDNRQISYS